MGGVLRSAKQANLSSAASSAYGRLPGAALTAAARSTANSCILRLMSCDKFSRVGFRAIILTMNAEPTPSELRQMTQNVAATASTPLARFVPGASAVPDQMIDQWVEQELRRGRSSMRAGLAMLACLAVVAIPLALWL
jgi:hypothetical protein